MGGRASSSGNNNVRGGSYTKSDIMTQSGQIADLGGLTLTYGNKDASLNSAERKATEAQEMKRLNNKIEYGAMYDANGNMVGVEIKGGPSGMRISSVDLDKSTVFTHNHPRGKGEEGQIGGTFSGADLATFTKSKVRTFRASGAEGTYSITKGSGFDANGLKTYYNKVSSDAMTRMRAANSQLASKVKSGSMSYSDYLKQHTANFNRMLVECHDGLLAGQKKYGYNYVLEER